MRIFSKNSAKSKDDQTAIQISIARMDGESTATSVLFWTVSTLVATVAITTLIENKFHWLKNNWRWMFGNKETR